MERLLYITGDEWDSCYLHDDLNRRRQVVNDLEEQLTERERNKPEYYAIYMP